jgi:deoxyribonuclease V
MDKAKLKEEQLELAKKLEIKDSFKKIKTIAGVDQTFFNNKIVSAIVVCDYKTLEIIEKKYAIIEAKIPYMAGYLAFREGPAIIEAYSKLEKKPDILIVEGHGISHIRKLGLASYIGVTLNIPVIGIAKNLLHGEIKESKIIINNF